MKQNYALFVIVIIAMFAIPSLAHAMVVVPVPAPTLVSASIISSSSIG